MKGTTQVILLMDGQIAEEQKASILVMLRKNEGRNVVHAIGLGNYVDQKLVRDIARTSGDSARSHGTQWTSADSSRRSTRS